MISIIIPTYNEEKHIRRTLSQLMKQVENGDEVIIVDSRSKDKTEDIAFEYGAKVLKMDKLGVGLARTHGAKNAKNEIIAFLDCDAEISGGWVNKIKKHFKEHKELEAVGGLDLYSSSNSVEDIIYNTYSRAIYSLAGILHLVSGHFWVPSNNGAFKKEIFLKLGGYKQYLCEDFEFTKRFKPKKALYDYSMVARLSDRRFKEQGFFSTLVTWTVSDLEAMLGIKRKDKAIGYRSSSN